MGGAYLVTRTVLYVLSVSHTHRSLQHSKASRYFQTVAELRPSVHHLCPTKHRPFAPCTNFHIPKVQPLFGNRSFKCKVQSLVRCYLAFLCCKVQTYLTAFKKMKKIMLCKVQAQMITLVNCDNLFCFCVVYYVCNTQQCK